MADINPALQHGGSGRPFRFEFIRLPDRRSTFDSTLLEATDEHIILTSPLSPSAPLRYGGAEVLGNGYQGLWFLFKGQPYDAARVYRPDGTWTGYYVDVLDPVQWDGDDPHTLRPLVDLFLDLWIAPSLDLDVLDEDELEAAIADGAIGRNQAREARSVVARLVAEVGQGTFPPRVAREFQR